MERRAAEERRLRRLRRGVDLHAVLPAAGKRLVDEDGLSAPEDLGRLLEMRTPVVRLEKHRVALREQFGNGIDHRDAQLAHPRDVGGIAVGGREDVP